jgi:phospholipid-transporting ATPase
VNEETAHATQDFVEKRLAAIKNQRSAGEAEDLALIIGARRAPAVPPAPTDARADGKSLGFALEKELAKPFLELALLCKAVVCCACS